MIAIYKRELKAFFHTMIGFLFIAVMLLLFGIYTVAYNVISGTTHLSYAIQSVLTLFMFAVPVLTMRILAEERRQKTDQLTLTSPVSVGKIVLGKYLACATVFMIPVAVMAILPLIYNLFGNFVMAESYIILLGYILFGLACIALSMFVSSFTESQVVAVVLSFGAVFLSFMMDGICSLISQEGNILTTVLGAFAFYPRFYALANGVLDLTAIVYYVTVIVLLLFLTTQSIQKRRYTVSVANFSLQAFSTVGILVAIAAVVGVNIGIHYVPESYTKYDMSKNRLYTMSDEAREVAEAVQQDVTITVYNTEDGTDNVVRKTLQNYADHSEHITIAYVDPSMNPQFANNYPDDSISQGSIVVESGEQHKVINGSDMYISQIDYNTFQSYTTGYDGEGQIASAIGAVTTEVTEKIQIVTGHNEVDLGSAFTAVIDKENIAYEKINLLQVESIGDDVTALIINTPQVDYSAEDADKVIDYLERGGKAIITSTYTGQTYPNFYRILSYFGVSVQEGYVVEDDDNHYLAGDPLVIIPDIQSASATQSLLSENRLLLLSATQAISVPEEAEDGITYTQLLKSSDSSFFRSGSDLTNNNSAKKQEGDIDGPFCVGLQAVKTTDNGEAKMYLFGTCNIFSDYDNQLSAKAHEVLFTKILNDFTERTVSVSVPSKSLQDDYLVFPQGRVILFSAMMILLVPVVLVIIGFVIWFRRRRK